MVHRTDHNFVKHTLNVFDLLAKVIRVFESSKQKKENFRIMKIIVILLIEVSLLVYSLTFLGCSQGVWTKEIVISKKYVVFWIEAFVFSSSLRYGATLTSRFNEARGVL